MHSPVTSSMPSVVCSSTVSKETTRDPASARSRTPPAHRLPPRLWMRPADHVSKPEPPSAHPPATDVAERGDRHLPPPQPGLRAPARRPGGGLQAGRSDPVHHHRLRTASSRYHRDVRDHHAPEGSGADPPDRVDPAHSVSD